MAKRKIDEYKREDADFITTATKEFSLTYPHELDDALDRIEEWIKHPQEEPGLTPLEVILRQLEAEARAILAEYGYPTDLDGLWWVDLEDDVAGILVSSAKRVLSCAGNVRQHIANNEMTVEAATEMMRLVFATVCADMHDVIITGVRAKAGRPRGGSASTKKRGIILVIKKALKEFEAKGHHLTRKGLWRYFKEHHDIDEGQNPIEIGNYEIYYSEGRLVQVSYSGKKSKIESISIHRFLKYVTELRGKKRVTK
jgi:hypothetical protein